MNVTKSLKALALMFVMCVTQAHANVVIFGTRVIFPSKEREVSIKLSNEGKRPALIQAWVDTGDQNASPTDIDAPFTLTPVMFRLEPGKGQTLRMIRTSDTLPADKESLYWLNILEIPPKATDDDRNRIQIAFRTRIKVMFRPDGLSGSAEDAPRRVTWAIERGDKGGYVLKAVNPTPYVVNIGSVALKSAGHTYDAGAGYVLPGGAERFPISDLKARPAADSAVAFGAINDWGGGISIEQPISAAP